MALLTEEPALGKQVIDRLWKVYLVVKDEVFVTTGIKNARYKRKFD